MVDTTAPKRLHCRYLESWIGQRWVIKQVPDQSGGLKRGGSLKTLLTLIDYEVANSGNGVVTTRPTHPIAPAYFDVK